MSGMLRCSGFDFLSFHSQVVCARGPARLRSSPRTPCYENLKICNPRNAHVRTLLLWSALVCAGGLRRVSASRRVAAIAAPEGANTHRAGYRRRCISQHYRTCGTCCCNVPIVLQFYRCFSGFEAACGAHGNDTDTGCSLGAYLHEGTQHGSLSAKAKGSHTGLVHVLGDVVLHFGLL